MVEVYGPRIDAAVFRDQWLVRSSDDADISRPLRGGTKEGQWAKEVTRPLTNKDELWKIAIRGYRHKIPRFLETEVR